MALASQFIGGPMDGVIRAVPNEPQTLWVPEITTPSFNPTKPPAPIIDHRYEKRAGGLYYHYAGPREIRLSDK